MVSPVRMKGPLGRLEIHPADQRSGWTVQSVASEWCPLLWTQLVSHGDELIAAGLHEYKRKRDNSNAMESRSALWLSSAEPYLATCVRRSKVPFLRHMSFDLSRTRAATTLSRRSMPGQECDTFHCHPLR
jgi:hypothetical protein